MKKTIVTLGIALCTLGANAFESTVVNPASKQFFSTVATPLGVAITKGEIDIVKKFVEYGADVNETSNGMTPLMIAARYNRVEIINFLLENGANPKLKNENGLTALRFAELSNASDAVAVLTRK